MGGRGGKGRVGGRNGSLVCGRRSTRCRARRDKFWDQDWMARMGWGAKTHLGLTLYAFMARQGRLISLLLLLGRLVTTINSVNALFILLSAVVVQIMMRDSCPDVITSVTWRSVVGRRRIGSRSRSVDGSRRT